MNIVRKLTLGAVIISQMGYSCLYLLKGKFNHRLQTFSIINCYEWCQCRVEVWDRVTWWHGIVRMNWETELQSLRQPRWKVSIDWEVSLSRRVMAVMFGTQQDLRRGVFSAEVCFLRLCVGKLAVWFGWVGRGGCGAVAADRRMNIVNENIWFCALRNF